MKQILLIFGIYDQPTEPNSEGDSRNTETIFTNSEAHAPLTLNLLLRHLPWL